MGLGDDHTTGAGDVSLPTGTEGHGSSAFSVWWMVAVLLLLDIVALVDRNIIAVLAPPIQHDLGLSDVQMSIALGPAFSVAYVLFGMPFGWAVDRFSRRWVVAVGSTIWSGAMIATGMAMNLAGLAGARAFVGAGEMALSPAAFSMIGDRLSQKRMTTALALYSMAPKLAQSTSFALGGLLVGYAAHHVLGVGPWPGLTGWRLVFVLIGVPGLALTLLIFSFREPTRAGRHQSATSCPSFLTYLRQDWRILLPLLLAASLAATTYAAMLAWYPTFLTRRFGWDVTRYGGYMSIISLISAGSVLLKGLVVDWLVQRGMAFAHLRFYLVALLIAAPCALVAFTTNDPHASMIAYGVADGLASAAMLYLAATIQIYLPAPFHGRINALVLMTITIVATGIGPMAVAAASQYVFRTPAALGDALLVVILPAAGGAVVMLWMTLRALANGQPRGTRSAQITP